MEAWERPVTESFLRLLININDHDAGIYSCPPAHLKTVIETAELKTVNGIEERSRALAQEGGCVNREGTEGDNQADCQRTLVTPPLVEDLDESLAKAVGHA